MLRSLEREWQRYVRETKRKRPRLGKPPVLSYIILSQAVTIRDRHGKRIRIAQKGKIKRHTNYPDNLKNLREAQREGRSLLRRSGIQGIGTVVFVQPVVAGKLRGERVGIWECKLGNDGEYYLDYKPSAAGQWWRRRGQTS